MTVKDVEAALRYIASRKYTKLHAAAYECLILNMTADKPHVVHGVAWCLLHGIGCAQNVYDAYKLFKLNWEGAHHLESLYEYALCLYTGRGCESDIKKAIYMFRLGADCKQVQCCEMWKTLEMYYK